MIGEEDACTLERLHTLRKVARQAIQKCTRKLERQQEELEESRMSLWYQQIGDSLLAAALHIPRGTSKITLVNVHTQSEESVSINPKMDLKENAQLFFKKSKKGKRGSDISSRKVDSTEQELSSLQKLEAEISLLCSKSDDINIDTVERLEQQLLNDTPGSQTRVDTTHDSTEKTPYRHFTLEGWNLYIGKNDAQNDELTTRFALPSDIWLHVAGHAGSHVVIRRPKGAPLPPPSVLETAASLSVWFSKAKHTSFAEVHYTEARFVRKRRHAPAGEVIAERCKSIRVTPRSPQEIFPSKKYVDEES
jgi:predicted ribosome quality control (RQC) complex YloA/Tae2 family protein